MNALAELLFTVLFFAAGVAALVIAIMRFRRPAPPTKPPPYIPPGWYDDGHGATRWYDGQHWTVHVR